MTHQESLLSPTAVIYYFMMSVWPWISLEREISWRWSLRTSSSQCHNNSVLVSPCKIPDHVKGINGGQNYDLRTRVDIWTNMDLVQVEYGTFALTFYLTMWFFQFITGITFKWYYVLWHIIALMVWICLSRFLWRSFMLN